VTHESGGALDFREGDHSAGFDAHYLGFFDCFNRRLFFEAHEVLETLWLKERGQPRDLFFKGLIQLAGAFVHVQKRRTGPAIALLRLSESNLKRFPLVYEGLELAPVLETAQVWMGKLIDYGSVPALVEADFPKLRLPALKQV